MEKIINHYPGLGQLPESVMEATQPIQECWYVWQSDTNGRLDDNTTLGIDIFTKGKSTHRNQSTKSQRYM